MARKIKEVPKTASKEVLEWYSIAGYIDRAIEYIREQESRRTGRKVTRREAEGILGEMLKEAGLLKAKERETLARSVRAWTEKWYLPEKRKKRARKPRKEVIEFVVKNVFARKRYSKYEKYVTTIQAFPVDDDTGDFIANEIKEIVIKSDADAVYCVITLFRTEDEDKALTIGDVNTAIREAYSSFTTTWYYLRGQSVEEQAQDLSDEIFMILTDPDSFLRKRPREGATPTGTSFERPMLLIIFICYLYEV